MDGGADETFDDFAIVWAEAREGTRWILMLALAEVFAVPEQTPQFLERQQREARRGMGRQALAAFTFLIGQGSRRIGPQQAVRAIAIAEAAGIAVEAAVHALQEDAFLATGTAVKSLPWHVDLPLLGNLPSLMCSLRRRGSNLNSLFRGLPVYNQFFYGW
jgi:hypothetical protein